MQYIRLYLDNKFSYNQLVELNIEQTHYVSKVMRHKVGQAITIFNGYDGLWLANIESLGKKSCLVRLVEQIEPQTTIPDIWLCFALVKQAPLGYIIEKATELGVKTIIPLTTERTVIDKINYDKAKKITIESAQQCERLVIPEIMELSSLKSLLENWDKDRVIIFCNERQKNQNIVNQLQNLKTYKKYAILTGPEGGFSEKEIQYLMSLDYIKSVSLGPRILRADTAVISALAITMSIVGDWFYSRL